MSTVSPTANSSRPRFLARRFAWTAAILVLAMTSVAGAQQYFKTPAEAAGALASAVRSGTPEAILRVLGRGGRDIASSGDEVADAEMRQRFLAAYDQKNQITMDGDRRAIMVVGQDWGNVATFRKQGGRAATSSPTNRALMELIGAAGISRSSSRLSPAFWMRRSISRTSVRY